MTTAGLLLFANVASTLPLVGLIWIVQLVHYPAFAYVPDTRFVTFMRFHEQAISVLVVPLMITELFGAVALVFYAPAAVAGPPVLLGALLAAALWVVTFSIQVPLHQQLAMGYDAQAIQTLVRTNWIRTLLWSVRGVLVLYMLAATS